MRTFAGKIAVITGAGSGIGRELALALARDGAHLALLDINGEAAEATADQCRHEGFDDTICSVHLCDVTRPEDVAVAANDVADQHHTDHINLLINNAGIGLTESFLNGDRKIWDRTFDVCWGGVYNCSRVFIPLVVASEDGHIVNISSVNGLWASLGTTRTHSAYCAAKFAVRGFTEALVTEMRIDAPHVGVSVVMPGHIGTDIVTNSQHAVDRGSSNRATETAAAFVAAAPTTPAEAAAVILDGVRNNRWRILVGQDAEILDRALREDPEGAYERPFVESLHEQGAFRGLVH
jgi:NAD(P)-dependent dehydrogenase (short-subunit alcohol dehydrogenase family)